MANIEHEVARILNESFVLNAAGLPAARQLAERNDFTDDQAQHLLVRDANGDPTISKNDAYILRDYVNAGIRQARQTGYMPVHIPRLAGRIAELYLADKYDDRPKRDAGLYYLVAKRGRSPQPVYDPNHKLKDVYAPLYAFRWHLLYRHPWRFVKSFIRAVNAVFIGGYDEIRQTWRRVLSTGFDGSKVVNISAQMVLAKKVGHQLGDIAGKVAKFFKNTKIGGIITRGVRILFDLVHTIKTWRGANGYTRVLNISTILDDAKWIAAPFIAAAMSTPASAAVVFAIAAGVDIAHGIFDTLVSTLGMNKQIRDLRAEEAADQARVADPAIEQHVQRVFHTREIRALQKTRNMNLIDNSAKVVVALGALFASAMVAVFLPGAVVLAAALTFVGLASVFVWPYMGPKAIKERFKSNTQNHSLDHMLQDTQTVQARLVIGGQAQILAALPPAIAVPLERLREAPAVANGGGGLAANGLFAERRARAPAREALVDNDGPAPLAAPIGCVVG